MSCGSELRLETYIQRSWWGSQLLWMVLILSQYLCWRRRSSGPQVTPCYTTHTDKLGFVPWGENYQFHFGNLFFFFPFIFLFLISNCQITLSSCWSAWRITILAYRFHNNSATLTNMTYFCPPYRPVDLNHCLCRVSKIDGLVCVFRGPWLPFVLPHTVRPGLRIPLRVDRLRGKEGCRRWASQ